MTILDMLDRLEAEIAALRALAAGRSTSVSTHKSKRARPTATKKKKPQNVVDVQAAAEANGDAPAASGNSAAEAPNLLGKRQALGRSLMQLRKAHGGTPGPH